MYILNKYLLFWRGPLSYVQIYWEVRRSRLNTNLIRAIYFRECQLTFPSSAHYNPTLPLEHEKAHQT